MTRSILLSAGVVLLLQVCLRSSEQPHSPQSDQPAKSHASEQAQDLNNKGQVTVPPPDAHVNTKEAHPSADGRNAYTQDDRSQTNIVTFREERGVCAQESASLAAWWMVGIAVLQLAASVAGIILLWWTLKSTREAAKAAMYSAKAAGEAISSDRAYICIDGFIDDHRDSKGFHFCVQWENCGRSPAILKSHYTEFQLEGPARKVPGFACTPIPLSDTKLGPGQTFPARTDLIDRENCEFILKYNRVGYLRSHLEYRDIFDRDTKTEEITMKITKRCDWETLLATVKLGKAIDTDSFHFMPLPPRSATNTHSNRKRPHQNRKRAKE